MDKSQNKVLSYLGKDISSNGKINLGFVDFHYQVLIGQIKHFYRTNEITEEVRDQLIQRANEEYFLNCCAISIEDKFTQKFGKFFDKGLRKGL